MKRIIFSIIITLLVFTLRAEGAMVRVVAIEDGRTITVDDHGTRSTVRLTGVAITDELRARELLRWTIGNAWVLVERRGDEVLVYRSPDAMFLNRELVLRGCARATREGIEPDSRPAVTYLGIVNPEGPQGSNAAPATRSGSGTRRPPRASPSPSPRARPGRSAVPAPGSGRARRGPSSGARTDGRRSPQSAD